MSDTNTGSIDSTEDRPSWSCQLHRPPKEGQAWMKADPGYTSCSGCLDRLRQTLRDIGTLYAGLTAKPGGGAEHGGRAAPGFGSRPPADLNVITMRDRRSLPYAVGVDAVAYVWDPDADHTLLPGQVGPKRGEYTERREVWFGADGRPHTESDHAMTSVPATLTGICAGIADMRELAPPRFEVDALLRWLDNQLDWLTRQPWCDEPAAELHRLAAQLRGVNDPRRKIGFCPNLLPDGPTTRTCEAVLFGPVRGDAISCRSCGRVWHRPEWEHLGRLIQEQRLAS